MLRLPCVLTHRPLSFTRDPESASSPVLPSSPVQDSFALPQLHTSASLEVDRESSKVQSRPARLPGHKQTRLLIPCVLLHIAAHLEAPRPFPPCRPSALHPDSLPSPFVLAFLLLFLGSCSSLEPFHCIASPLDRPLSLHRLLNCRRRSSLPASPLRLTSRISAAPRHRVDLRFIRSHAHTPKPETQSTGRSKQTSRPLTRLSLFF